MNFIYIAGPYTGGDQVLNVRAAIEAAQRVVECADREALRAAVLKIPVFSMMEYEEWTTKNKSGA
jgi:hypothetical protein